MPFYNSINTSIITSNRSQRPYYFLSVLNTINNSIPHSTTTIIHSFLSISVCVSMATLEAAMFPSNLKLSSLQTQLNHFFLPTTTTKNKRNQSIVPVARLLGPAVFEASKLKVVYVGVNSDEENWQKPNLPRTYTLTHCDLTSKLTLAISRTINTSQLQGWYNRLQRDEVVGVWKKIKGKMSLHVHCHISGGHFLLDLFANLRYYIFCKELPLVLKAFVHGDEKLFKNYPELQEALAWVYFHSNIPEYNKVECWGPLYMATDGPPCHVHYDGEVQPCDHCCDCCSTSNN